MLETLYDLLIGDYRTLIGVILSAAAAYVPALVGLRTMAGLLLVIGASVTLALATFTKAR